MENDNPLFQSSIEAISAGQLDVMGLISAADRLFAEGAEAMSVALYQRWLTANASHPLAYVAAFNCGTQLMRREQLPEAVVFLSAAAQSNPGFFAARQNLALAFEKMGSIEKAIAALTQVEIQLNMVTQSTIDTKVSVLKNLARLHRRSAPPLCETALLQAVEIDPSQNDLIQHWAHGRQERCIWPVLVPAGKLQPSDILRKMQPLAMSAFSDNPYLQLATAWSYNNQMLATPPLCKSLGNWSSTPLVRPEKMRIGYLSSDFCNHAIGYLISDIFAFQDRQRFDITVFNLNIPTNDPIQQKIRAGVDHWFDVHTESDQMVAKRILDQGIDILLDMNGHTNQQRPRLLAMKPAPVIVNWLGYPGTMGSDSHHFIIADDFIIPTTHEKYYSEKVVRLPCYQPNGRLFEIPQVEKTRKELGLPDKSVVYCCFNGAVKITPSVFKRWMAILGQVGGSVLWLRGADEDTQKRLRDAAVQHGIAAERIVFLPFCSNTEYLGCHRYADVFLDTFPYGAHTTASDALRMGVPIVTLVGASFASRVCGSLSTAAGLTDLICETPEQYVAIAVRIGNDTNWREQVRMQLQAALPTSVLFDAQLTMKSLEALFEFMWSQYSLGTLPSPRAPDLAAIYDAHLLGANHGRDMSIYASQAEYDRQEH